MEYQKIIDSLDNAPNHPTKFRTKNCVEINDDSHGRYNTNNQIKFKTSMLKSSLCDYSDAYILVKESITVPNTVVATAAANHTNKKVIFKNGAPFINYISEINNTQVDNDNAKDIDVVMPLYKYIEYSNNYSKTSGRLWQYLKVEPAVAGNGDIMDSNEGNPTKSFNSNAKTTG